MGARKFDSLFALRGLAFAGLVALAVPLPAAAAGMENALKACTAPETLPSERMKQCNAAIASGEFKQNRLAQALFYRGAARIAQKNYAGAISDFDEALRQYPDQAEVYFYRGVAWERSKDPERALADYNKAIALEPGTGTYHFTRASIYEKRQDYPRAIADYSTAISLAARPHREYAMRGYTHENAGERDKAVADYQKALEIDPDLEFARLALHRLGGATPESAQLPPGKCSANDISHEERATGCAAVIESGKTTGWPLRIAYCNLGYALTELGDYDRVITSSDAAISIDTNSACAYLNRGRAWYYKNDIDRAIADYTQTLKLDPAFHEAYASRGTAYHERRDFARAIADYDAAISITPDYAPYYSDRGNTRMQMGDNSRAVADLTRAIELDPKLGAAYTRRGWAFLAFEDYTRAEADFDKAIELGPDDAYAGQGRTQAYKRQQRSEPPIAGAREAKALSFEQFRARLQSRAAAPAP